MKKSASQPQLANRWRTPTKADFSKSQYSRFTKSPSTSGLCSHRMPTLNKQLPQGYRKWLDIQTDTIDQLMPITVRKTMPGISYNSSRSSSTSPLLRRSMNYNLFTGKPQKMIPNVKFTSRIELQSNWDLDKIQVDSFLISKVKDFPYKAYFEMKEQAWHDMNLAKKEAKSPLPNHHANYITDSEELKNNT